MVGAAEPAVPGSVTTSAAGLPPEPTAGLLAAVSGDLLPGPAGWLPAGSLGDAGGVVAVPVTGVGSGPGDWLAVFPPAGAVPASAGVPELDVGDGCVPEDGVVGCGLAGSDDGAGVGSGDGAVDGEGPAGALVAPLGAPCGSAVGASVGVVGAAVTSQPCGEGAAGVIVTAAVRSSSTVEAPNVPSADRSGAGGRAADGRTRSGLRTSRWGRRPSARSVGPPAEGPTGTTPDSATADGSAPGAAPPEDRDPAPPRGEAGSGAGGSPTGRGNVNGR